jgi:redox-sensitive bicupin YhaK (pirin superfamily)
MAFVYPFEGDLLAAGNIPINRHHLAVFGSGKTLSVRSGQTDARFILVAGKPLGEPIVQYGPFVMNTRAEIEQAFSDYQSGRLVKSKAEMKGR